MREIICVVCPSSCRLAVDNAGDRVHVTGAKCEKGIAYGIREATAPVRTVSTTVRIEGAAHARLPVKTVRPVAKGDVRRAVEAVHCVHVSAPVAAGDIVCEDAGGTGAVFAATRDMKRIRESEE